MESLFSAFAPKFLRREARKIHSGNSVGGITASPPNRAVSRNILVGRICVSLMRTHEKARSGCRS